MGIHGIYKEIGPGTRIALSKLALNTFISRRRPLRLAVDISIWLFQVKSSKGGEQPALRTFYYRLLRLTSLAINPLFVFDGPNKPRFKRNKHTGPNICTIPEFLAKQLLKEFGLPYYVAPGEAEAECAHLQRAGVVDAVLSEDVDTIMFGSGITLRNWSAEGKGKVPTHVNMYDSKDIVEGASGLDREGMILVAMMSGGDYIPEGIPGCGPKTACEAARAGFGAKLCKIARGDKTAFEAWKTELAHELRSNESKFFRVKHASLQIPDSFPNQEILRYYTHPAVSDASKIEELRQKIVWQTPMQLAALRKFTEEAFKWETIIGAKKFIRTLAPALLVRQLSAGKPDENQNLILKIHQAREHASTDNTSELRASYVPQDIIDIDLSIEAPEDVSAGSMEVAEDDVVVAEDDEIPSNTQIRPYLFDPSEVTKIWVFEHFLQLGAPQQYEQWKNTCKIKASKIVATAARQETKKQQKKGIDGAMPVGAMHQFAKITKPASSMLISALDVNRQPQKLPFPDLPSTSYSNRQLPPFRNARSMLQAQAIVTVDLAGCEEVIAPALPRTIDVALPSDTTLSLTARRRTPFARSRTEGSVNDAAEVLDLTNEISSTATQSRPMSRVKAASKRKAQLSSPAGTSKTIKKNSSSSTEPILITSSPIRQESITHYFSPSRSRQHNCLVETEQGSPTRSSKMRLPNKPDFRSVGDSHSAKDISKSVGSVSNNVPIGQPLPNGATETGGNATTNATSRGCLQLCDGNKQRVRVRESLPGAFAIEEDADSRSITYKAPASTWSLKDIPLMDLTGDLGASSYS